MEWYWPKATQLAVKISDGDQVLLDTIVTPDADGIWRIDADINATSPVNVHISPRSTSQNDMTMKQADDR